MMMRKIALLGFCSFLGIVGFIHLAVQASEPITFDAISLKYYPRLQLLLPKMQWSDRFYVQSNFKPTIASAQAVIDGKTLVRPLGSSRNSFMPPVLVTGYTTHFTDVIAFPTAPFKQAQHNIVIEYDLDGGKHVQVTLERHRLQEFLTKLP